MPNIFMQKMLLIMMPLCSLQRTSKDEMKEMRKNTIQNSSEHNTVETPNNNFGILIYQNYKRLKVLLLLICN